MGGIKWKRSQSSVIECRKVFSWEYLIKGDVLYGKAEVNSEGFFRAVFEQV